MWQERERDVLQVIHQIVSHTHESTFGVSTMLEAQLMGESEEIVNGGTLNCATI